MLSRKPWDLLLACRLMLAVFVGISVAQLGLALVLRMKGLDRVDENSLLQMGLATLGMHGTILLLIWFFLARERIKWSEAFGFSRVGATRAALSGVLVTAAFLPAENLFQMAFLNLLEYFKIQAPQQQVVQSLQNAQSLGMQIYMTAFSILLAPVAEEMLFRGILYPTVKQMGFPRVALWGTSLLFGLIHVNFPTFIPLSALALLLVFLYEKTDNLLAPIVAHSTFNACNVAYIFLLNYQKHQSHAG